MNKKIIIGSIMAIAALGALYYYREDIGEIINYTDKKDDIMKYSNKKIKAKPVDIKIKNLNEL